MLPAPIPECRLDTLTERIPPKNKRPTTQDLLDRLRADVLAGKLTRRQTLARAAALGLAVPALSGFRPGAVGAWQASEPVPGGILKVGLQADPTALDPRMRS